MHIGPTGLYGSDQVCRLRQVWPIFNLIILSQAKRDSAMKFLDLIPDNYIVIARNISGTESCTNTYAADWQADTTAFGT